MRPAQMEAEVGAERNDAGRQAGNGVCLVLHVDGASRLHGSSSLFGGGLRQHIAATTDCSYSYSTAARPHPNTVRSEGRKGGATAWSGKVRWRERTRTLR